MSLPSGLVDASNLRQIPDHQEVFLREHTLTSVIFEINEYQTADHLDGVASSSSTAAMSSPQPTAAENNVAENQDGQTAAAHHLMDIVQAPDYIAQGSLNTTVVSLLKPSVAKFPTYHTSASIITPEIDLRAARQTTLPVSWQSNPVQREYETKTQQLLVRMEEYGVDFCVRVNVPLKEFVSDGVDGDEEAAKIREAGEAEVLWAMEAMDMIVKSLDVKDFGLFGGS